MDFSPYLPVAFLVLLLVGAVLLVFVRPLRKPPKLPYVPTPILTATEVKFFHVLERAAPQGCYVLAQVRLANVVKVKSGTPEFWRHFSRIGMKCVDFVVVDYPTMKTLLVVELDDRTHEREDRRERDIFVDDVLHSAGVPIMHCKVQSTYNSTGISEYIASILKR